MFACFSSLLIRVTAFLSRDSTKDCDVIVSVSDVALFIVTWFFLSGDALIPLKRVFLLKRVFHVGCVVGVGVVVEGLLASRRLLLLRME